jgi:transcriptional regulator GlxA family with amidase domain
VKYIHRRRVARARDLLPQTQQTCSEIAFEAGFGSVQHLHRLFRRHEALPPAHWRRSGPASETAAAGHG